MGNSLFSILTYRHGTGWAFTDRERGLVDEPFVAGADTLIEKLADGADEVHLVFSTVDFPGSDITVKKTSGTVDQGTYYTCVENGHELWLCPALGKYFPESPEFIHVKASPVKDTSL